MKEQAQEDFKAELDTMPQKNTELFNLHKSKSVSQPDLEREYARLRKKNEEL